jgi:BRCT domain type II-containing protein
MRRFIAGCMLGIKKYKIKIVDDEEVDTLINAISTYKTKHKDGTDVSN